MPRARSIVARPLAVPPAPPPFAGSAPALPAPEPAAHAPSWGGVRVVTQSPRARGLTPERLAAILQRAEDGDVTAQSELLSQMEQRDGHLASVLRTRKRAVAGLPWTVEAASDKRRDRQIAEYCTSVLKNIPRLRRALVLALDAIAKGYSFTEIDWRQAPGRVWVAGLVFRPPHWFNPDQVRPDVWTLRTPDAPTGTPLEDGRWIRHEVQDTAGSTSAGAALGRVLAWPYLFRNYAIKDWIIFAERCGAPIRTAKYRPGTSEADLVVLYKALQQLGVDAAAMIPEGTSIDFTQAPNSASSADIYAQLVEWGAREMSKAVLGQTLTTEEGKSGSRALGQVHDQVRQDLLESDAAELSETISQDLIRPLVDFQFGPQATYPRFCLDARPPADLSGRAELYKTLEPLGVRFPVQHIHETFGIPEPKGGEPTYGGVAAPPGPAPRPAPSSDPAPLADDPVALPPLPAEAERIIREALDDGEAGWATIIEQLRRHLDQATDVGQLSGLLIAALEQLDLTELADALSAELLRADLVGRAQAAQGERPVGDWPAVPPLEASTWWRARVPMTDTEWLKAGEDARAKGFTVAKFSTLQACQQVQAAIDEALMGGQTLDEFESRYQALLAAEGMTPESPAYIETVFRNNVQTAYAVGRYTQLRAADTMSRRPYWLYDAVDDARVRPAHKAMDRKVYPADHPVWDVWYPPNGHRCRCSVRALTAAELAGLGLEVATDFPARQVKRVDGSMGPKEMVLPDEGWRRNAALSPHEFDWSQFPPDWRMALRVGGTP